MTTLRIILPAIAVDISLTFSANDVKAACDTWAIDAALSTSLDRQAAAETRELMVFLTTK